MGFSDIGCFGSEIIETPNLDRLASEGVIFTQFYNSARCCPSRASLLTGVYPHQAGMGSMTDQEISLTSYQGYLTDKVLTIPQILKKNGYRCYISGKWHLGDEEEHYPLKYGFDRCLALIQGASSYFEDIPYRNEEWPWGSTDNFHMNDNVRFDYPKGTYSTDLYTDYAIEFINESRELSKPFFLYLSYTAPHWPLHALPEDIAKYDTKFNIGWDQLREMRYENLLSLGIIDSLHTLSKRNGNVKTWESLSEADKNDWSDKMEVYSAMIDRLDQNIGRLIEYLKKNDQYENSLIMFLSDNGGCRAEMVQYLSENFSYEAPAGSPRSFDAYGQGWANVSNTPFRRFKAEVYEGGIASPFILSFPQMKMENKKYTFPIVLSTDNF
jgi:arylsulfatase